MNILQILLTSLVILIHIYIVVLEMVWWTNKRGMRAFGLKDKTFAQETKVMAANQGLYNGFLAAGLLWSILSTKIDVAIFFLICVAVAGVYGAYSIQKNKILYIQTIPALLAISSLLFL